MGVGFEGEPSDACTMRLCQPVQRQQSQNQPEQTVPSWDISDEKLISRKLRNDSLNLQIKQILLSGLIGVLEKYNTILADCGYTACSNEQLEQHVPLDPANTIAQNRIKSEQETSDKKEEAKQVSLGLDEEKDVENESVGQLENLMAGNENNDEYSGEYLEEEKDTSDELPVFKGETENLLSTKQDGEEGILDKDDCKGDLSGLETVLAAEMEAASDKQSVEQDGEKDIFDKDDKDLSGVEEKVPTADVATKIDPEREAALDKEMVEQNGEKEILDQGDCKSDQSVVEEKVPITDMLPKIDPERKAALDKEMVEQDGEKEKGETRNHRKKSWKEIRDLAKAEKKYSGPLDSDIKVKKMANETNGGGGGQINRPETGSDLPAVGNKTTAKIAAGGGANGNDGDEDEEGGRRRCFGPGKKRLDCDRPGTKKRPKERPGNHLDRGDNRQIRGGSSDEMNMRLERLNLATNGPSGDERPRSDHSIPSAYFEAIPRAKEPLPRTFQNVKAVKRFYSDDAVKAPHKVQPGGAAEAMKKSESAEEPMEVTPEDKEPDSAVLPQTMVHGTPQDVVNFAHHLDGLKEKSASELQGLHMGVVLDKDSVGSYRDRQYIKEKALGHGTFGDVYLFRIKNKAFVVAKQILPAKFVCQEAILWCNLVHPNILPFLGLFLSDGMVTLLSEYRPCQSLQKLLEKGVLGQGRALLIIEQVFQGLEYLCRKEIVHRDIKPDNILISEGRILLIDFGVAERLSEGCWHVNKQPEGTECYMAPEIAGSKKYDHRVDIWSSGCTLICLISGNPPWAVRFKGMLKIFIIAVREPPLEDIPFRTHPKIREFLELLLKKDVNERPTAAQALQCIPLDIVDELYSTPAIETQPVPEPEPVLEHAQIPEDAFEEPLTPWTPRGPENKHTLFAARTPPTTHMSLSSFYISHEDNYEGDDESSQSLPMEKESSPSDQLAEPASSPMKVDGSDEDMYGPPLASNVGGDYDDIVISGHGTVSHSDGGQQNKDAALSFMQDEANTSAGNKGSSSSFELEVDLSGGESRDCNSLSTAYADMMEAGKIPGFDETDVGGFYVAKTSGFDSRRLSEEDRKHQPELFETISSTPSGVSVTIFMDETERIDMRITPDFTVRKLAKEVVNLPKFSSLKLARSNFTLVLKSTNQILPLEHTFMLGRHELVAIATSDVSDWRWCIDMNGNIDTAC